MFDFIKKLFRNIRDSFRGKNIFWHLLAILITYAAVSSGFDWFYFTSTQKPALQTFLFPAVILGGLLPIFVPLFLLIFGYLKNNFKLKNAAWALAQAAMAGWIISSFYKAFTGRIPPPHHFGMNLVPLKDISHGFQLGLLRGGIFWGWPSSHTTIAFAMGVALWTLYPKNRFVRYAGVIYAFYVGLGVSISIHWFSEFAAGALIGSVIGVVIGKSFMPEK